MLSFAINFIILIFTLGKKKNLNSVLSNTFTTNGLGHQEGKAGNLRRQYYIRISD